MDFARLDPFQEDFSCPGAPAVAGETAWVALEDDGVVVPLRRCPPHAIGRFP